LLIGNGTNYTSATLTAGTAIGVTNASGSITIANTGVTSAVAGTGITVSGSTGAVTITNAGVTSFQTSLSGLSPSASTTGGITLSGTLGPTSGGTGLTAIATGDLLYGSASNTLSRLSAGSNGYVLTLASGIPAWAPSSGGGGGTYTRTSFTATGGQTTFTVSYNVGYVQVYLNGVLLNATDYTATSGTSIVLAVAASSGDIVEVIALYVSIVSGVAVSGTPTVGQIAIWTNSTTVQGTSVLPSANGGTGVNNGSSTLTLSANNTAAQFINNAVAVTVTSNAGTVPITSKVNNFTNSSAATMAITMAVTGAVDGQMSMVRIYDFSAATQTIGWTNTENSTASVPTTSNGSTTLPVTVGFQYNGQTSKWRCIATA